MPVSHLLSLRTRETRGTRTQARAFATLRQAHANRLSKRMRRRTLKLSTIERCHFCIDSMSEKGVLIGWYSLNHERSRHSQISV